MSEPLVSRVADAEEAAERTAEVLATAIDAARTVRGAAHLESLGCDVVQGFHVARPMPAADLVGWLAGYASEQQLRRRGVTGNGAGPAGNGHAGGAQERLAPS